MVRLNEEHKEFYQYLSNHSGMEVKSLHEVRRLFDSLHVERVSFFQKQDKKSTVLGIRTRHCILTCFFQIYNKSLPVWTESVFEKMHQLSDESFAWQTHTLEMQRLAAGPILFKISEIFKNTSKYQTGNETNKALRYSYTDHTLFLQTYKACKIFVR